MSAPCVAIHDRAFNDTLHELNAARNMMEQVHAHWGRRSKRTTASSSVCTVRCKWQNAMHDRACNDTLRELDMARNMVT